MDPFLDEYDPEPEALEGELVEATPAHVTHARIRALEDEVLQEATSVIRNGLRFGKIEMGEDGKPIKPEGWTDEEFRLATYSLASAKDAPVGLKTANQVYSSIVKARATEKAGPRQFNVAIVNMPFTKPNTYPELDVTGQSK